MSSEGPSYDFDELYPGRFLKAGDFAAGPRTLRIRSVDLEDLPDEKTGGTKARGVVAFEGEDRELVLNKTNGLLIRAMFGRSTKDWIGKRVTFWMDTKVKFGSKTVEAVRVYGSPEIPKDLPVPIKHPKKKEVIVTLKRTGEQTAAKVGLTDEQKGEVVRLRGELAKIIRGEQEEEASALTRATEMGGTVRVATFKKDLERIQSIITREKRAREEE